MVWEKAGKTEYPDEPCMKCANFGFMGCGGCTYPDQDGTCKEFVPENLDDEEETNARWPPREDLYHVGIIERAADWWKFYPNQGGSFTRHK